MDEKKENFYPMFVALRTATGITKNKELAKDAVQETFVRAYRNLKSFDTGKPYRKIIDYQHYRGIDSYFRKNYILI